MARAEASRFAPLIVCALVAAGRAASAEESTPAKDAIVVEPGAALTETQKQDAKSHFSEGRKHYAAGEFNEAADHFVKAYDMTHAPELLYNLARCYEHLDEKERAAEQYEMYLRMSPDAEDRTEVEEKIRSLVGEPEPQPEKADGSAAPPPAEKEDAAKIVLGVSSGIDIPITAEWDRKSIPVDVVLLFGINDWLHLGFGLAFVGFVGDEPVDQSGYPTGGFALHGDLAVLKTIKGRFAFLARLAVTPTWLFRWHTDTAFWLLARVGVGLHVDIWKSFGVLVEAVGAVGPVFNRDPEVMDNWPAVSLAVDAGARLGITYVF